MEKILLTRAGYEKLIRELEFLSQVERPQVIQEILEAAQEGRVEKNPDFQSAQVQRRQLERRIRQLQQTLANAEVLVGSNLSPNKVRFNARVRVVNLNTGQEREYKMVGPLEADAASGHLSLASPLGKALLGRAVGDRLQVQTPRGLRVYKILEIYRGTGMNDRGSRPLSAVREQPPAPVTGLLDPAGVFGGGVGGRHPHQQPGPSGRRRAHAERRGRPGTEPPGPGWTAKPPTAQKTFGYHRLEILVALVNGLVLWAMAGYIFYEAAGRFFQPPAISSRPLIVIASLGLLVNLFGMYVLMPSRGHNLNLRSAFLHLLADSFGSVAAIAAGVAIWWQGWYWFDPLAGGIVGVLIVISSWQMIWEAADILLESTPGHIPWMRWSSP